MDLDGDFADADVTCDLLAETPTHDMDQNLALAGRERRKARPERGHRLLIPPPRAIASQRKRDCIEQVLVAKGLRQELDGTTLHRLHRHRDIAVTGDEDDRDLCVRPREFALKIETALSRQSHI